MSSERAELDLTNVPPSGWRWVEAPTGYRRSLSCPPFARWVQCTGRPQDFACTTRDAYRWLSVVEAEREGWIVKDDAWMRFVNVRFPRG